MLAPPELPEVSPNSFIALMALGFVVATVGHIYRSRLAIAVGMILIVIAVIILPLIILFGSAGGG